MKNLLFVFIGAGLLCLLVSWGYDGHYAVAKIAESHLTPEAQAGVKNLLGHKSMADVASYADEIRSDPAYRSTGDFHFLNIQLGLSYEQFEAYVRNDPKPNIYKALIGFTNELRDATTSKSKKEFALEFIIHLVGDAHQPMHVSRAEDRGGNNTSVTFLNMGTNLHGLWDDGLLAKQKINYHDLAAKYDDATPQQISKWQNDDIMIWLWESYQISSILYKEAAENSNFDEQYYQDHIPIVKSRIEKGGIRLAGLLNNVFKP